MPSDKATIMHGRRGGGWVDHGKLALDVSRLCTLCGRPMVCGQRAVHLTCCAAAGGVTKFVACQPIVFTHSKIKQPGCAHCGPKDKT